MRAAARAHKGPRSIRIDSDARRDADEPQASAQIRGRHLLQARVEHGNPGRRGPCRAGRYSHAREPGQRRRTTRRPVRQSLALRLRDALPPDGTRGSRWRLGNGTFPSICLRRQIRDRDRQHGSGNCYQRPAIEAEATSTDDPAEAYIN